MVEDEAPKRERLLQFLKDQWVDAVVRTAKSVRSAISDIQGATPQLLLLDMSLPTFDIGPDEPGGRPQGFGGIEVMRYVDLFEIKLPIIVVTAYEAFSRDGGGALNHDDLDQQLRVEHPENYRGLVYYNSLFSDWKTQLAKLIVEQLRCD
ncbi:response regulator [Bradyrhizobium sp. HKCCYLS3070]